MTKVRKSKPLFVLAVGRIPGGYRATARVATRCGYVTFCATARRQSPRVGEVAESPKMAAMKEAVAQAFDFASSPQGNSLISGEARSALSTTLAVREMADRAKAGDPEARVRIRKLKQSPHRSIRKAVHSQRLFEEKHQ